MTIRRVAARYGHNVCFGTLVQLALLTGTRTLDQRALKPLLAEALAYPDDRASAYRQRIGYSVINLAFVGLEQRQRSLYRARRRSATVGDFTQSALLGLGQLNSVLACGHIRQHPRCKMRPKLTHFLYLCQYQADLVLGTAQRTGCRPAVEMPLNAVHNYDAGVGRLVELGLEVSIVRGILPSLRLLGAVELPHRLRAPLNG